MDASAEQARASRGCGWLRDRLRGFRASDAPAAGGAAGGRGGEGGQGGECSGARGCGSGASGWSSVAARGAGGGVASSVAVGDRCFVTFRYAGDAEQSRSAWRPWERLGSWVCALLFLGPFTLAGVCFGPSSPLLAGFFPGLSPSHLANLGGVICGTAGPLSAGRKDSAPVNGVSSPCQL